MICTSLVVHSCVCVCVSSVCMYVQAYLYTCTTLPEVFRLLLWLCFQQRKCCTTRCHRFVYRIHRFVYRIHRFVYRTHRILEKSRSTTSIMSLGPACHDRVCCALSHDRIACTACTPPVLYHPVAGWFLDVLTTDVFHHRVLASIRNWRQRLKAETEGCVMCALKGSTVWGHI